MRRFESGKFLGVPSKNCLVVSLLFDHPETFKTCVSFKNKSGTWTTNLGLGLHRISGPPDIRLFLLSGIRPDNNFVIRYPAGYPAIRPDYRISGQIWLHILVFSLKLTIFSKPTFYQCCGSGSGRIRIFFGRSDPDPYFLPR